MNIYRVLSTPGGISISVWSSSSSSFGSCCEDMPCGYVSGTDSEADPRESEWQECRVGAGRGFLNDVGLEALGFK